MNPEDTLIETPDEARYRTAVDTLLDGDAVDKSSLRDALSDAATRDYFIDALLLRQLAVDMAPNTFHAPGRPVSPAMRAVRWTAAAAVVVATGLGGYTLGRDQHAATQAITDTQLATPTTASVPAPEPTRTIRFEPGKNWISNVEGR